MPDPEYEEKKRQHDQEAADMNMFMRERLAVAEAREVRGIELLEQISRHLEGIEQLLLEKLGVSNDH